MPSSSLRPSELKVATVMRLAMSLEPICLARRWVISVAAFLVKVTARICSGRTPFWSRYARRRVRTVVLPEPGAAMTSTGPLIVVTAAA
ncbi:hypothetical protein D3C86_1157050 [compost metagenome]